MQTNTLQKQEKTNSDVIKSRIQGENFKTAVQQVLPKHLTPERFVRVALMAMTRTPGLGECDQASLIQCLLNLSQLGLEPDGRRAHLIPFGKQCQLIVDYKGYVELLMNTGLVSTIHADIVCEEDEFVWDRGEVKKHIYGWGDRGEVLGVYAIIKFKDGTEKADRMSRLEVEAVRARSRAGRSGPWVTDWNEMAKKTVFRRLVKWAKISPEQRDAIEADDDQFDHHLKTAKGTFGSDATVGIFSAQEQAVIAESSQSDEPEPVVERPAKPAKVTKVSPPTVLSAGEPKSEAPSQSPAASPQILVNDKTRLAEWMSANQFSWSAMQPLVAEFVGAWAQEIGSFEELNVKQCTAILAQKAGLETELRK